MTQIFLGSSTFHLTKYFHEHDLCSRYYQSVSQVRRDKGTSPQLLAYRAGFHLKASLLFSAPSLSFAEGVIRIRLGFLRSQRWLLFVPCLLGLNSLLNFCYYPSHADELMVLCPRLPCNPCATTNASSVGSCLTNPCNPCGPRSRFGPC